jgi:hypothetical protein
MSPLNSISAPCRQIHCGISGFRALAQVPVPRLTTNASEAFHTPYPRKRILSAAAQPLPTSSAARNRLFHHLRKKPGLLDQIS